MKKKYLYSIIVILTILIIYHFGFLSANAGPDPPDLITANKTGIDDTAAKAGLKTKITLPEFIGDVLGWGFGILGTIFLLLIIVGGFIWMTSSGNEQKVDQAKKMIGASIIGILIIFLSYAFAKMIGGLLAVVST